VGSDPDVVVVGAGPNGLVAACALARAGLSVLVLEAHPTRAGGALGSDEGTRPGFVHDVGAAFFPFARSSPAFRGLALSDRVEWSNAPIESAHPARDGTTACLARDLDLVERTFGAPADGGVVRRFAEWHARVEPRLLGLMLGTLPSWRHLVGLGPVSLLRALRIFLSSGAGLASRLFRSEAARRVVPSLSLHVDVGPDDPLGAGLGWLLAMTATTGGFAVPRGGAQSIVDALLAILAEAGGEVRLGARAARVVVANGRAVAVRLASGEEFRAAKAILADTAAPSLLLDLVERAHVPARVVRAMERFPRGWGTFKMDWALSGPVPWASEEAARSAVVHAGESLDDLRRFTRVVRAGDIPPDPYLVVGQQSLADETRAPAGQATLWAYSRVPPSPRGGWSAHREAFADAIDARIEGLAPGFRARVLARRAVTPPDLEAMDANLVGGDLGGGSNAWNRQLVFRPVFPYFRYRTPIRRLYLCSSYAHPGAGVHGMCGWNAAEIALSDLG
jgi:phytoene dehydrogenase-like protein